ncbi:MAG: CerR family C-terminal domain-containing protein [Bauldia sp.]|nr:CerR family C-terminal domain-containing protein [Bauldia sp.]
MARVATSKKMQPDTTADDQAEGESPASRHYRRAQRDRGADTRARLIAAALDVFGREGFEGATTRQIAREADANLAAIVYHFGGKEELYRAVAEYIVEQTSGLVGPAMAAAGALEASATVEAARATLLRVIATYVDVILGADEAERWARFIIREQLQPTSAFDVIYGFMGGAHALGVRLVARILGRSEDDEEVRIRVFAMMGQILVFRVAHTLVLRRMDWASIGEEERAAIRRVVLLQVEAILDSGVRS